MNLCGEALMGLNYKIVINWRRYFRYLERFLMLYSRAEICFDAGSDQNTSNY